MFTPLCSVSPTYFLYVFLLLVYPSLSLPKYFDAHNVKVASLLSSDACMRNQSSKGDKQGSYLEVVHKYGPCIEQKNHEKKRGYSIPNQAEMLLQDQLRVESMHARFSKTTEKFKEKKATLPLRSGIAIGTGDYVVTVGLGTPKKDLTLIFDTGSDITWTQCRPCAGSCYSQSQPIFDPTKSSSYKNVSCSSSYCNFIRESGAARGCSSSTCVYQVEYGDGSYSIGYLATDTLSISSSAVFKGFMFGCDQQNTGQLGRTAGLLALGPSQVSFSIQTAKKFRNIFSYCIPSSSSSTGHLSFGEKLPNSVKFTPLSSDFQGSPYYGIEIIGISVGGRKLAVDVSVFGRGGAIIDSGTVLTWLQPTAYSALRSAFEELMKDYPKTNGYSILDTCYDFSEYDSIVIPKISVFFKGGVELEIKPSGNLVAVETMKQVCLAFTPNDDDADFAIFGNTQQQTYEIVHDLANARVGFAPNGCS